jgi:hypothetical protein
MAPGASAAAGQDTHLHHLQQQQQQQLQQQPLALPAGLLCLSSQHLQQLHHQLELHAQLLLQLQALTFRDPSPVAQQLSAGAAAMLGDLLLAHERSRGSLRGQQLNVMVQQAFSTAKASAAEAEAVNAAAKAPATEAEALDGPATAPAAEAGGSAMASAVEAGDLDVAAKASAAVAEGAGAAANTTVDADVASAAAATRARRKRTSASGSAQREGSGASSPGVAGGRAAEAAGKTEAEGPGGSPWAPAIADAQSLYDTAVLRLVPAVREKLQKTAPLREPLLPQLSTAQSKSVGSKAKAKGVAATMKKVRRAGR